MRLRVRLALATTLLLTAAFSCSSEAPDANTDPTWVGTITTEGNVTTVVNESGSLWGGIAKLVEEASMGVEEGEAPYLFGRVSGIATHSDRIFVLDGTVPVIRVFDMDGEHLDDIGREGEGPGEFGRGLRAPSGIALDDAGRIYVHARTKIEIFSPDGEHLDTWPLGRTAGNHEHFSIAVTAVGSVVLARTLTCEERFSWRCGTGLLRIHEGVVPDELEPLPDLGYQMPRIETEFRRGDSFSVMAGAPPFVPGVAWNVDPSGRVLIGRADRYEIERHATNGTKTVISRFWDPVAVQADEAAWYLRLERLRTQLEGVTAVRGYDLDDGLPDTKPAFNQLIAGADGSIWVVRPGPGEKLPGCAEDGDVRTMSGAPCWRDRYILDVFGADGRYMGEVEIPEIFYNERFQKFDPQPYIANDLVLVQIEDAAGTIMVKRYRLVLPADDRE